MMLNRCTVIAAAVTILLPTAVFAQGDARDLLMRIAQAARTLNYDGTFVYQRGSQLDAVRIVHQVKNGRVRERLVSLSGAPREVIRDDDVIACYLPDDNSVLVEYRKTSTKSFPALLPEKLEDIEKNYVVEIGKPDRIAGRDTQTVVIQPRDNLRYGYMLWADRKSSLLLKTDLMDRRGVVLEQFMFAQIEIGGDIPNSALAPETSGNDLVWYREKAGSSPVDGVQPEWIVNSVPKGFMLTSEIARVIPIRGQRVRHLVYSDGLAAVSIFIEKLNSGAVPAVRGASRMGAVHAFGRMIGDHHVTIVGEVPAGTVALFGGAITAKK
jgi:sigma-E factor negative regulatory protein RseB